MTDPIASFVRSTRAWTRWVHTSVRLTVHGLFVGFVLLLVGVFRPEWTLPTALGGGTWLVLVFGIQLLRRGVPVLETDRALGLEDRLTTWWQVRDRRDASTGWLEVDLAGRLAALPPERRSVLWRRQARRLWWLVPLLLIVWVIGPFGMRLFMQSDVGATKLASTGADGKPEAGDGTARTPTGEGEGGAEQPQGAQPTPQIPDPGPRAQPPQGGPETQPPRPIPQLPAQDEFVIPRFIGDGDGRKQRTKVAVTEEGPGGRRTARPTPRAQPETTPERRAPEFRAAAERALRARHVPPPERPFVRRYFQELVEGGR